MARAACRVDLAGGTMDMWPLYLFHPGAVVVNIAVQVMTTCRIIPLAGGRIELVSLDTGLADSFESMQALREATQYRHALAAHLLRFFYSDGRVLKGDGEIRPPASGWRLTPNRLPGREFRARRR